MAYWLPQLVLFAVFMLVSASVEYRRTGLILAGFAALYLGLNPLNTVMDGLSPSLYILLYAVMDYAAAYLVFQYGSKGKTSQVLILSMFVFTHIMAWSYTLGNDSLLDPHRYVVVTRLLAGLQILVIIPGIKDGAYEVVQMVQKTLAKTSVRLRRSGNRDRQHIPLQERDGSVRSGLSVASGGSGASVLHPSTVDGGQDGGAV